MSQNGVNLYHTLEKIMEKEKYILIKESTSCPKTYEKIISCLRLTKKNKIVYEHIGILKNDFDGFKYGMRYSFPIRFHINRLYKWMGDDEIEIIKNIFVEKLLEEINLQYEIIKLETKRTKI